MDKYPMTKKYIDELDYLNLLKNYAPGDEFDVESKEIAAKVTELLPVQEIAWIIAGVFNKHFNDNNSPDMFMDCAKKIYDELHH